MSVFTSHTRYNLGEYLIVLYPNNETASVDCFDCGKKTEATGRCFISNDNVNKGGALCYKCMGKYNLDNKDLEKRRVGFSLMKIKRIIW